MYYMAYINLKIKKKLARVKIKHFGCRDGYRKVATFLQESILIVFDFICIEVLFSDRNFATLLDSPLGWDSF